MTTSRFFSPDSFWNTPIRPDTPTDPGSDRMIGLPEDKVGKDRGFWINCEYWSVPVYEVDGNTPRRTVHQRVLAPGETYKGGPFRQGPGFGRDVPVPPGARPSPESDQHLAVIDRERQLAWDMWGARWRADGELESFTGMCSRLDGPGVFDPTQFAIRDGESLHRYGPSRHAGFPAYAGLIMRDEILNRFLPGGADEPRARTRPTSPRSRRPGYRTTPRPRRSDTRRRRPCSRACSR